MRCIHFVVVAGCIQSARSGTGRANVFFRDPMNANRKSQIERNYELVREPPPRGVSFDALAQKQIDLVLSHVNACIRQSQSDSTPNDVFEFIRGEAPRRQDQSAGGLPQATTRRH